MCWVGSLVGCVGWRWHAHHVCYTSICRNVFWFKWEPITAGHIHIYFSSGLKQDGTDLVVHTFEAKSSRVCLEALFPPLRVASQNKPVPAPASETL